MVARTFSFLGVVASALALASLLYGIFNEPLGPYMQGLMGGMLDAYRSMRDAFFDGVGWTLSSAINLLGEWLSWLPKAPWFTSPKWLKDVMALWVIASGATFRAETLAHGLQAKAIIDEDGKKYSYEFEIGIDRRSPILRYMKHFAAWPAFIISYFNWHRDSKSMLEILQKEGKDTTSETFEFNFLAKFRNLILLSFFATCLGSVFFFVLVYAESRIGL